MISSVLEAFGVMLGQFLHFFVIFWHLFLACLAHLKSSWLYLIDFSGFGVDLGSIFGGFWMVVVRFGGSRTLQEGQGRSRTKVEKSQKNAKYQKCERFSTNFRSVNDSLQFSDFQ